MLLHGRIALLSVILELLESVNDVDLDCFNMSAIADVRNNILPHCSSIDHDVITDVWDIVEWPMCIDWCAILKKFYCHTERWQDDAR